MNVCSQTLLIFHCTVYFKHTDAVCMHAHTHTNTHTDTRTERLTWTSTLKCVFENASIVIKYTYFDYFSSQFKKQRLFKQCFERTNLMTFIEACHPVTIDYIDVRGCFCKAYFKLDVLLHGQVICKKGISCCW